MEQTLALAPTAGILADPYKRTLALLTALLTLSFPVASWAVFGAGADRTATAAVLSCVFVFCMSGLLIAPFLPFATLRGESRYRRLERMVYIWIFVFVGVALTWEIPWALLHERIAASRDELWAYTWWAYIDGVDLRYVNPSWLVFFIEGWADTNGLLSAVALYAWFKSGKTNPLPIYYFMFAAPLHIYPTVLYYVSEIATGMPNVDTTSPINLYVKFGMANSFWVIVPFFVFVWGAKTLERIYTVRCRQAGGAATTDA
jgi:hypothetical protein